MSKRKKIVFLTSRVPYPLEKGDKLRAYHQIRFLSERHDVYLCVVSAEKLEKEAKEHLEGMVKGLYVYQTEKISILINLMVSLFYKMPFQVGYFFNTGGYLYIQKIIEKIKPDHLFVQLIRMSEYVKYYTEIPKTLDYMDCFSLGMKRRMEKGTGIKRWIYKMEYQRLAKYEKDIYSSFNHHFIISEQDKKALEFPEAKNVKIALNGVDDSFFRPDKSKDKKYDLLFTGNMSYPPNVDAVEFIVKKVLPIVWKKYPDCTLLIAGASPNPLVKSLAGEKVIVSGWMDDIRQAYYEGKIFIAPLNIGSGLQNKLLEAMSMELPCVTSELANNSLFAKANEEILLAKTPEEYAECVFKLMENSDLSSKLALNGKIFVQNNYHWQSIILKMEEVMFGDN